jgi:hypothetical protein
VKVLGTSVFRLVVSDYFLSYQECVEVSQFGSCPGAVIRQVLRLIAEEELAIEAACLIVISQIGESGRGPQGAVGGQGQWVHRCADRVTHDGNSEGGDPAGWIDARPHGTLQLIA